MFVTNRKTTNSCFQLVHKMIKLVLSVLIIQLSLNSYVKTQSTDSSKKLVCYYTNWSQYRAGLGRFVPENIDPFLCTHVIYAYARLDENGLLQPFEWNDIENEWSSGMYGKVMGLKKKNKDLKILLAAGGEFTFYYLFFKFLFMFQLTIQKMKNIQKISSGLFCCLKLIEKRREI